MNTMKTFADLQINRSGFLAPQGVVDYSQAQINTNAIKNVNDIFRELAITFPAWRTAYPDAESLNSAKQVWAKGLIENDITSMAVIRAGLRVARSQAIPFIPSVGQFVAWCKDGIASTAGLPSLDETLAEFNRYNANRDRYPSAEVFPWSHPVLYWIVLDVREAMYRYKQTEAETLKALQTQLTKWGKKLAAGGVVPMPVVQITDQRREPSPVELLDKNGDYRRKGAELLAVIRAKQKGGTL
ncbi:replication protein P [Serratia microhaemolytica]|uniref:replication protein P n=1 Tax=Serratia microhaemolytica TaxID=2675110 RepID=UPI000FDE3A22|nr:replication protein P [Serratia microhaemolytica]